MIDKFLKITGFLNLLNFLNVNLWEKGKWVRTGGRGILKDTYLFSSHLFELLNNKIIILVLINLF